MCWTHTTQELKVEANKHMESSVALDIVVGFQNDRLQLSGECGTFIPLHHIELTSLCQPCPLEIHLHIFISF